MSDRLSEKKQNAIEGKMPRITTEEIRKSQAASATPIIEETKEDLKKHG